MNAIDEQQRILRWTSVDKLQETNITDDAPLVKSSFSIEAIEIDC